MPKQPKYPLTDKWINKTGYIYTHKGIVFNFKRKGILIYVTGETNLEDIMLSETGHSQKDKYRMIPPR